MIVLLHARDPEFDKEASKRGVFAHISDADVNDWPSSIDIVLRRFSEYHELEGAFGRRSVTERAKGILMERHSVDEAAAFEMLAPVTLGEAWHNNHHAFPTSARHGLGRWQLAPGAWLITRLERCHLAWDVVRISAARQQARRASLPGHRAT